MSDAEFGVGKMLSEDRKKPRRSRRFALFQGATLVTALVLSILCFVIGIAVFVIPAGWVSMTVDAGTGNQTCPAITPANSPYSPVAVAANRQPFITAWDGYVAGVLARPEGVRAGCAPMRFPATAAYRGVAVIHHGFSSCPQEMADLGPPLAAKGYDVVFPLLPGHGNAIRYEPDAPNFLWSFLGVAFSLLGLVLFGCVRYVPCAACCTCECCRDDKSGGEACCGFRNRTRCICITVALLVLLLITSLVGYIIVLAGGADFCISLSFVDGVGPGCDGMSEYNDNLPKSSDGYTQWLDTFDTTIASQAVGELVLAGLSGGGGAALYSSRATRPDGTALYKRVVLIAPYIDVATIGPALTPAINLGLGELKVDFGADCRIHRRGQGKAGYCNYRLNRIDAMRGVAAAARDGLTVPPGQTIDIVKVEGDATVTNSDITALATQLSGLTSASAVSNSSLCVLRHVDMRHSPLSVWNYIHMDVELEWIMELVCQTVAFLADGVPFPIDAAAPVYNAEGVNEDVCDTSCDLPNACSYDCNADAFFTCPSGGTGRRRRRA